MTVRQARCYGTEILSEVRGPEKSATPALDADVLLQHILSCDKTFLLFHGDTDLAPEHESVFREYVRKRCTGLPVAYITGHKEFYGYDFSVSPATLIPKPDTELLVEKALEAIAEMRSRSPERILSVCDMCAGTGCVGISIVKACAETGIVPAAMLPLLTLSDISADALALARMNARNLLSMHKSASVVFSRSNLFGNLGGTFDIIVSNPPYVPATETAELLKDGRSEPALALNGDVELDGSPSGTDDGLSVMRNLVPQCYEHLSPGGILLAESGEYNAPDTKNIFERAGFSEVRAYKDLSGQMRVTEGRKPL